ncbi:uncharacterized protein LOC102675870 isoform X1 [Apis dorsata]|uniref:uncharacterized protein LOC102675870 isoform X1 n=2 Tax=Apis dorsata TaxID=7462 RepID=UPI0003DF7F34|nr:uncharacterized protein LOC102675870 isoform X1 [Apis dorsata]
MSYSSSLSGFVIPIINSQPKSYLSSVNTNIFIESESKRTCEGKNDISRNLLIIGYNSEKYEEYEKEYKTMGSAETTHLFCDKSIYEAVQFGGSKQKKDTELVSDNFKYYTIDPICMNIRLCIFWFLWAMLIVVIIISILSHCCFISKICHNTEDIVIVNVTNTVSI